MDEDSKSHMERRMNSYMQSREDQVFHRRTRFALDMDGNMIFDDDGCVTKTKKFFMQTAEYYKVDGEEITQVNYTEESDHLTVLYSKVRNLLLLACVRNSGTQFDFNMKQKKHNLFFDFCR